MTKRPSLHRMNRANAHAQAEAAGLPSKAETIVPTLTAIAATCVALAAADSGGTLSTNAISLLAAGVLAAVGCLALLVWGDWKSPPWLPTMVFFACAWAQATSLSWSPIDWPTDEMPPTARWLLRSLIAGSAITTGLLCARDRALGAWVLPLVLALQAALGLVCILSLDRPAIDVLTFQQGACEALCRGDNPYAMRFIDPLPPGVAERFYGMGVSQDGWLQFGYPYMPITLILALPGYALGDVRFATLACAVAAAALIAFTHPSRKGWLPAALFACSPISPLVMLMGWTEPFVVLLGAVVFFCLHRRPALVPYAFGLFLVGKQYMPALAPLGLLLLPRPWTAATIAAFASRAAIAGTIVTLPFILWDISAFWNSALALQLRHPFRPDALSFLAWASPSRPSTWLWIPFLVLVVTIVVGVVAGARRSRDVFTLCGIALLFFFSTNRQAFANYYFLVVGLLWMGVAFQDTDIEAVATP